MSSDQHDASWALELLRYREDEEKELPRKYVGEISGMALGIGILLARNNWLGRPWFSAPALPLLVGVGYATLSGLWNRYFDTRQAVREEIYREHIRKHPEDFPNPERIIGDLFEPWRIRR